MIFIAISLADFWHRFYKAKQIPSLFVFFLLLLYVFFGMSINPRAIPNFNFTKKQMLSLFWQPSPNKMQGPMFYTVFPKNDQDEVVAAVKKIDSRKRLCFDGGLLVAELPPLIDRVLFPLQRCKNDDILVIGPYQKGQLALIKPSQLSSTMNKVCKKILFSNMSYALCSIKKN